MLDEKTCKILSKIIDLCGNGSYTVIAYSDLLCEAEYDNSTEEVKQTVMYLIKYEFLSCKYYDDEYFCVLPLPKGRLYEEECSESFPKELKDKNKLSFRSLFWAVFLGNIFSLSILFILFFIIYRCFYA